MSHDNNLTGRLCFWHRCCASSPSRRFHILWHFTRHQPEIINASSTNGGEWRTQNLTLVGLACAIISIGFHVSSRILILIQRQPDSADSLEANEFSWKTKDPNYQLKQQLRAVKVRVRFFFFFLFCSCRWRRVELKLWNFILDGIVPGEHSVLTRFRLIPCVKFDTIRLVPFH